MTSRAFIKAWFTRNDIQPDIWPDNKWVECMLFTHDEITKCEHPHLLPCNPFCISDRISLRVNKALGRDHLCLWTTLVFSLGPGTFQREVHVYGHTASLICTDRDEHQALC